VSLAAFEILMIANDYPRLGGRVGSDLRVLVVPEDSNIRAA
jgi:hypothetical protein